MEDVGKYVEVEEVVAVCCDSNKALWSYQCAA